jgi:chloramphenicol-sensitive protein RarD
LAGLLCWGLAPVYWKQLSHVPAFEILLHRVVWSALFLLAWLSLRGGLGKIKHAVKANPWGLSASTLLIGANWYIFIWGVNEGRVLEVSLGYFMLPLVIIGLGVGVLRERLRPLQKVALLFAGAAVANLLITHGSFPWLSLFLAATFAAYALLRKTMDVDSMTGLAAETFLLAVPCAFLLLRSHWVWDPWLLATPLVTALPLLWYTEGVRRLPMRTVGFLQYVAPTCQFLLGVFLFHEPLRKATLASFVLIWAGLALSYWELYTTRGEPEALPT